MTSEKQVQANRINALKGGVKTEEGKDAIGLNAVTHGFFSNAVLLPGEDQSLLDEFRDKYMAELKPVGELETLLVERIVSSSWRLKRLLESERKHTRKGADYRYDSWQNYIRYETTLERQIYKALNELKNLRKAKTQSQKHNFVKSNPIRI
jgi:hypothetical protein